MTTETAYQEHHDHGDGLHEDLVKLATRRDALRIFGAGGAAAILATLGASNALAATPTGGGADETAGPYPGDGSNGPDVLDDSGHRPPRHPPQLRQQPDARQGRPAARQPDGHRRLEGLRADRRAAVYLWHCDRSGRYSMYSSGVEDENYLRGIAKTDSDGTAWFRTIFPACYSGRWPHIHFEVYSSVAKAVANGPIVKTSQIALPKAVCRKVYATSGYAGSLSNLARTSLSTDNVFSDDRAIHQLATVTGSVSRASSRTSPSASDARRPPRRPGAAATPPASLRERRTSRRTPVPLMPRPVSPERS